MKLKSLVLPHGAHIDGQRREVLNEGLGFSLEVVPLGVIATKLKDGRQWWIPTGRCDAGEVEPEAKKEPKLAAVGKGEK